MRSLKADHSRLWMFGVLFVLLILASWVLWLFAGRVAVYAVSESARLETVEAVRPIQSLYTGRIAASHVVLGQKVKQGDVLIELDSNIQQFQLLEERMQRDPLGAEVEGLQREIAAEELAMQEETRAAEVGVQEAEARLREADAARDYAELDLERKSRLHAAGLISEVEFAQARTESQKKRAAAEGLSLAAQRQRREQVTRTSDRRSRIESLRRNLTTLSGQISRTEVTVNRLESEMAVRRIVASTDGIVGELADLKVGAVVPAGEKIGAIIPPGGVKVVARFTPAATLGRIRAGQRARLRLEGFPWTQYGTVSATVANVANEVRDGLVRVELEAAHDDRLHLQHGLPGAVEVEVDQVSPGALLLRLAGRMLPSKPLQSAENNTP